MAGAATVSIAAWQQTQQCNRIRGVCSPCGSTPADRATGLTTAVEARPAVRARARR